MKGEETELTVLEEAKVVLHKVFIDLSLENDLKKEELEWFKSKLTPLRVEDKEKKTKSEFQKIEILSEHEPERPFKKPNRVFLKLQETETIFLFSLPSNCVDDVEKIQLVTRANQTYEMKKTKKEIIRKRCMADVQTPRRMVKSRSVLTAEIKKADTAILASEWDMYDTYNALGKSMMTPSTNYVTFVEPSRTPEEPTTKVPQQDILSDVFLTSSFQYASLITERLLASNCYQSKQSVFKKKFNTKYDTEPTMFTYAMEPLWSFQKELKNSLTVTSMDWNPSNQDILAVGYGDLSFEKESFGLVCIWSSKNPRRPEKQFHFEDAVTSLHFSRTRPNIVAVATRKGNVYVQDVSTREGEVRRLGSSESRLGPIWKVEWFLLEELALKTEDLLAVGENGVLMIFSTSIEKNPKEILKLEYVTSTQKYPEKIDKQKHTQRLLVLYETFDKKIFSGLCFSICERRNYCYISTKEGVVLKCDLRNPSMTNGIFLAHDGPVHAVQHSPVTDLIFLTCGADWCVKIWMEGINQPLLTLQQKASVTCASWSPTIPTVIASVAGTELFLWDIARNTLSPKSTRSFNNGGNICQLQFSSNGANITMGSEDGLVHVIHLSELPRIPFLQKEALVGAIRSALTRNENKLYVRFQKAVEANRNKLTTQVLDQLSATQKDIHLQNSALHSEMDKSKNGK